MKRLAAGVIASLAVAAGAVAAPTQAHATDYGVDMNQACQLTNGAGWVAELTYPGSGAYGWRCWVPPWGVRNGVNVQLYCSAFGLGNAVVLNPSNAYSWRCRT